jgi:hypothetical protein
MTETQSLSESGVRHLARREGYMVRKSRSRTIHADNHGEYMLVDVGLNIPAIGARYDASLEEITDWLQS